MGIILKFLLIVLVLILLAGAAAFAYLRYVLGKRDRRWPSRRRTEGSGGGKKALVVYQPSLHRSCEEAAEKAAEILKEEGYTVVIDVPCTDGETALEDYEVLVFGSPVYMGYPARPLTEYVGSLKAEGKKILFYVVGRLPREEQYDFSFAHPGLTEKNRVWKMKLLKGKTEEIGPFLRQILHDRKAGK